MPLPFERSELPVPTDPVDAQQLGKVTSELNSVTRLIALKMPGDPDVQLCVQFGDGYSELRHGAVPFVGQPASIVQGRTDRAVRIEKAARNLVVNPSFETNLDGWSTPDAAVAINRDLGHVYNGDGTKSTAAMRMQGQNRPASPWAACTVAVESYRRYSASAWVFSPAEATTVQVELCFGGGNPSSAASPPLLVLAGKWTRICVTDAFSGNNTSCEVRVRLAQEAPSLAIGSRVSSWTPTGTSPAKDNNLQINQGDVILAAVTNDPNSNGGYRFHMATATVPGPGEPALRLDDSAQAPALAAGSRVSVYRPATGDAVPVGDNNIQLNAGDLVFCRLSGRPYGFSVVTTGAVGVANPALRLDDDGSPPDFEGALLSRFVPAGTALADSTGLALATGDMAFCHLVDIGRYDFVPVTSGGTGPGDQALRLADESGPPNLAAGSRLSFLAPSHTALATDTTIALAAGDAILASAVKAPMDTAYRFHMVTVGGSGPADPGLRVDDGPTTAEVWVDCVQLEDGRSPSSYLDHLQGLGYSGQATTATSRAAGTLAYPVPAGLSPEEGTLAFWFRPNYNSADGEAHFLVDMAEAEFANRVFIRKDVANRLTFTIYDDQDGMRQVSTSGPFGWSSGDWVHIAATWRNGSLQLYFQGQPVPTTSSGSGTGRLGVVPDTLHVGSSFLGFDQADGLLTDLLLTSKETLPDRIAAMASSPTGYMPTRSILQPADIPSLDHWKIHDFDSQVHNSRLDQMAAPMADVSMNNHRITALAEPTSAQDAATRSYVDDEVAAANPMTGVGDLIHGGTDGAVVRLGANTATRRKFLVESGTGSAGNAPAWSTIGGGDLRDIYVAATGSADTYSATADPAPASLVAGMMFLVKISTTNTGASTLDLNSLGATSIKTQAGSDPAAGALVANGIYLMVFDGTNFQLM